MKRIKPSRKLLITVIVGLFILLSGSVWAINSHTVTVSETIPCTHISVDNSSYPQGISPLTQECQNGTRVVVHRYSNLFSKDKGIISSTVTKQMTPEIRQHGTAPLKQVQPTIIHQAQPIDTNEPVSTDCSTSYIGSSGYTNCYSSDGTTNTCSSSYIGNNKYTHCY